MNSEQKIVELINWLKEINNKDNKNQYNPDYTVHPGDHIVEHLKCMDDKDYFYYIRIHGGILLNIITNREKIDTYVAQVLAHMFNTSKDFWINLQRNHDEWMEKNAK